MKKLNIPCNFGNSVHKIDFYIGNPKAENHPIQSQNHWLSSERGGTVSSEILDSLKKLHELSKNNDVDFSELCSYAIDTSNSYSEDESENQESSENASDTNSTIQPEENANEFDASADTVVNNQTSVNGGAIPEQVNIQNEAASQSAMGADKFVNNQTSVNGGAMPEQVNIQNEAATNPAMQPNNASSSDVNEG